MGVGTRKVCTAHRYVRVPYLPRLSPNEKRVTPFLLALSFGKETVVVGRYLTMGNDRRENEPSGWRLLDGDGLRQELRS